MTLAPGVLDRYASMGIRERLHTWLRAHTCPFAAVEAALPGSGDVLDIGCGHGLLALWAVTASPGRRIHGVDVDPHKIAMAERSRRLEPALDTVSFEVVPREWTPIGSYDAIVLVDVLYLLSEAHQERLVSAAARAVRPGGRLLVKEMAPQPRWKHAVNRLQETVSVKLLKITAGGQEGFTFVPLDRLAGWIVATGMTVSFQRCDQGYAWPHHLLVGSRPHPDPAGDALP